MYLTLYRKYRPTTFEEVIGETHIIKAIKNSLREKKVSHAYLFTGPRGIGKTTTARLIAKGLNCKSNGITDTPCNECENCLAIDNGNFFDLIEIDAASNRGIDEIRQLKEKINYQPTKGERKVYIIDEVHMLTKEAFNALLKTLEEPPLFVTFILATTEPEKVLDTIISRCQRFDFSFVTLEEISKRIRFIAEKEKIDIDEESIKLIYEKSGGSVRDTISTFEKVASYFFNEKIVYEKTEKALGIIPKNIHKSFIEIIEKNNLEKGIEFINNLWIEGIYTDEYLRSFANFIKENISDLKSKYDLSKLLNIIDEIYDILFKFKFEEDKKAVGYIVLNRIIAKKESKSEIVYREPIEVEYNSSEVEKQIEKKVTAKKPEREIKIEDLKKNWN